GGGGPCAAWWRGPSTALRAVPLPCKCRGGNLRPPPVPPVQHLPALLFRDADQAGMGVGGEGLVRPAVDDAVGNMVGIEADVDGVALQPLALQPGLDHVELAEPVAIAPVNRGDGAALLVNAG